MKLLLAAAELLLVWIAAARFRRKNYNFGKDEGEKKNFSQDE